MRLRRTWIAPRKTLSSSGWGMTLRHVLSRAKTVSTAGREDARDVQASQGRSKGGRRRGLDGSSRCCHGRSTRRLCCGAVRRHSGLKVKK
jgi:hypothetical protein